GGGNQGTRTGQANGVNTKKNSSNFSSGQTGSGTKQPATTRTVSVRLQAISILPNSDTGALPAIGLAWSRIIADIRDWAGVAAAVASLARLGYEVSPAGNRISVTVTASRGENGSVIYTISTRRLAIPHVGVVRRALQLRFSHQYSTRENAGQWSRISDHRQATVGTCGTITGGDRSGFRSPAATRHLRIHLELLPPNRDLRINPNDGFPPANTVIVRAPVRVL
ncbi:MAG: hypothetical protein FWD93_03030, partial [Coriobacteriia bacterium]|nr:hypothetical protein [Coriobacteriia bacterium]